MTAQKTEKQLKIEARQREVSERFVAWWNRGAEKAKQSSAARESSETGKRQAA